MAEERRRELAGRGVSRNVVDALAPARTVVIRVPFLRLPRAPAAANAPR